MEEERRPESGAQRPPRQRKTAAERASARKSAGSDSRRTTRRKKKRGGRTAAKAALYVICVIGVSVLLATVGWMWAGDVLALNKPEHSAVIHLPESAFEVREVEVAGEEGEPPTTETVYEADMGYVADVLKEEGLIEYKSIFKIFAAFTGGKNKIRPGTYTLTSDMDYSSLIGNMGTRSNTRVEVTVTIPEGYTVAQIFSLLEEEGVSTVTKLNDMAATHDYKFDFLAGIPLGSANRLEGYLFPDTYQFYVNEDPLYAINKMLVNFDNKLTDEMRADITAAGLTIQDVVKIASLIEKETDGTDQGLIASVIYNRMNHPEVTGGLLQIDAAIVYATGREVTQADYEGVDSPYNTYLYAGLPPTAIANPGAETLWAAIHPKESGYYYYALGTDKLHHFSKTYGEHQSFLASLPKE